MSRRSRTISQPVFVPQLVSSTLVPGRYRRAVGTLVSAGPSRKPPAPRSSNAPNTLGESERGRHNHSMLPAGSTSAVDSQSDRNPYSAIGGYSDFPARDDPPTTSTIVAPRATLRPDAS